MSQPNDDPIEPVRHRTEAAFAELRSAFDGPRKPRSTSMTLEDEFEPMPADQVERWVDGACCEKPAEVPERMTAGDAAMARLWVVTEADVLHAGKTCEFGLSRSRFELKHTNLTGGGAAYIGGELIVLDAATVVVNGDSGRYGPGSGKEMDSVLQAFTKSGYRTYTTGHDADSGFPVPLIGYRLELVA